MNDAAPQTSRSNKVEGRRATCTPWVGGNGLRLRKTERRQANKATRRRSRQALKNFQL
tara:strand:- start:1781 stop:1954 length:174 start_codon:yes stop_codon:yes gene_type:complete